MSVTHINFIGAGKLGQTLAKLIIDNDLGQVVGVCNKHLASAEQAIKFINQGQATTDIATLPAADITFITTPDSAIETCANKLADSNTLKAQSIIIHCSGTLPSVILKKLKEKKACYIYSVHPMKSFADAKSSVASFAGTYCALEGCLEKIELVKKLFKAIGAQIFSVNTKDKAMYHAAGVMASNYLVTLYDTSIKNLLAAGVEASMAHEITLSLMRGTLKNLDASNNANKALTGPIKRGDIETINKHLAALPEPMKALYKTLGLATLDIAAVDLDENIQQEITDILK